MLRDILNTCARKMHVIIGARYLIVIGARLMRNIRARIISDCVSCAIVEIVRGILLGYESKQPRCQQNVREISRDTSCCVKRNRNVSDLRRILRECRYSFLSWSYARWQSLRILFQFCRVKFHNFIVSCSIKNFFANTRLKRSLVRLIRN